MALVIVLIIFGIIAVGLVKPKEPAENDQQKKLDTPPQQDDHHIKAQPPQQDSMGINSVVESPVVVAQPTSETVISESVAVLEKMKEDEKISLQEAIKGKIRKSRPLTMNEQPLFAKLRATLEPEYVVLSQVSFGAILWTWSNAVRNRFNRKIVDFVVCDRGFNVVAVIELDDSSHQGKEARDADRDLILNEAGIQVIRYRYTPDSSQILRDIQRVQVSS